MSASTTFFGSLLSYEFTGRNTRAHKFAVFGESPLTILLSYGNVPKLVRNSRTSMFLEENTTKDRGIFYNGRRKEKEGRNGTEFCGKDE
jgi:hypothetical protein